MRNTDQRMLRQAESVQRARSDWVAVAVKAEALEDEPRPDNTTKTWRNTVEGWTFRTRTPRHGHDQSMGPQAANT